MAELVENPPAMEGTWLRSLGWEDPLEKGKAAHSRILAWRIPWTEEPGATVHGVVKSRTQLKRLGMNAYSFVCVYIYTAFSLSIHLLTDT